jgi:hypothetical protein
MDHAGSERRYDARVGRPRILCVSFSPIIRDARVLRQISVLQELGEVTTIGYGAAPPGSTRHLEIDAANNSLPRQPAGVLKLATRRLRSAELAAPAAQQALELAGGLEGDGIEADFDLVVANDARALPVAHRLANGAPVWADMHEWAPEEFSDNFTWRTFVAPLMRHNCSVYLARSAAVTTVCEPLAERYRSQYGVATEVVRNASAWVDLQPSAVADDQIRLVHSGGAQAGRRIDLLIRSALDLGPRFTLDLYLVAGGDGGRYLEHLRGLAGGAPRIRFHDPVTPEQLPATLNVYDVGVYCLPPISVNTRYALPNKFFDFIQARLAVAVGPSEGMAPLTAEFGLGPISADFTEAAFTAALEGLDATSVRAYKAASHAHALELSSERDVQVERDLVTRLLGG